MSYKFRFKQKSLSGRFLFILGLVTFVACVALGLMFIFGGDLFTQFNLTTNVRITIGSLLLVYATLRFLRLFKTEPDEE